MEIDIDEETLSEYKNARGKFSRKLKQGIDFAEEGACFKLDGKGRCVFLNNKNLCDIILNRGENALCQICTDHPRFRNYYSDRTEIGLGLCCEEAARIILSQNEPFSLEVISDDSIKEDTTSEEKEFFKFRELIFEKIQETQTSLKEKTEKIIKMSNCDFPDKTVSEWVSIFLSLERLDDYWTVLLNNLTETNIEDVVIPSDFDNCFKNLLIYFTYRHLKETSSGKDLLFIVLSYKIITELCKMHIKKYGSLMFEDVAEYSRVYSSEIEYSDENIEKLLEIL